MCSAVVASACGSSPQKKRTPIYAAGGGAGEPSALAPAGGAGAGNDGDVPAALGGQGGAASTTPVTPTGGASEAGMPSNAGAPDAQGGAPPLTGTGLSLPGVLKFSISCGTATAQTSLLLTNWSDAAIDLSAAQIEGPYKLETALPLSVASGESVELVVSTAPGVVGTDAPGDKRLGKLTLTSNLGTALIHLDGAIGGAKLEVDSIRGAPLATVPFVCSSNGPQCPTQTFTIVNTGTSQAVLKAPSSENLAVAAFVPGSPEPIVLEPGAAVVVEVRPIANGKALTGTTDKIFVPVEGSCQTEKLTVPVTVDGINNLDPCDCRAAPPGLEAAPLVAEYACGTKAMTDLLVFNGTTADVDVTSVAKGGYPGGTLEVANTLPLTIKSGGSELLQLLPPMYPGYPGNAAFSAAIGTAVGEVLADVHWRARGGSLYFGRNSDNNGISSPLVLNDCAPFELALENLSGTGPVKVSAPVVGGGLSVVGFSSPQTIQPGQKFVFSVAPVSNAGNSCATTGSIDVTLEGDCKGASLSLATSYSGACTCNGP
jgi:hypothetical protein